MPKNALARENGVYLPHAPPCLVSKISISRVHSGGIPSVRPAEGWTVQPESSGRAPQLWLAWTAGVIPPPAREVTDKPEFRARKLKSNLAQICREGLASKYLRQGGGQNRRGIA